MKEILDEIAKVRSANRVLWLALERIAMESNSAKWTALHMDPNFEFDPDRRMAYMRLAVEGNPTVSKAILRDIRLYDLKVCELVEKLVNE